MLPIDCIQTQIDHVLCHILEDTKLKMTVKTVKMTVLFHLMSDKGSKSVVFEDIKKKKKKSNADILKIREAETFFFLGGGGGGDRRSSKSYCVYTVPNAGFAHFGPNTYFMSKRKKKRGGGGGGGEREKKHRNALKGFTAKEQS